MFRKMIHYESLKNFQKKSVMELNLGWQLKYKLANWGSFDVSKFASRKRKISDVAVSNFQFYRACF